MKWGDTPLYHALKSLDLSRRLVSAALDGSLAEPTVDESDVPLASPGGIEDPHYFSRSVLWRIFLNVLTVPYTGTSIDNVIASWCPRLFTLRAQYASQKQQFHQCYPEFKNVDDVAAEMEEQALADVDEAPPATHNKQTLRSSVGLARMMLAMTSAANTRRSSIGKGKGPLERCANQVAEDIIALDIKRTYLTNDPEVPHHALFNILTVWRWLHPVVGYHQGMHEIAGVCLQVLSRAVVALPEDCPPEIAECANAAFREADAYYLFDGIMSTFGLAELFHATTVVGGTHLRGSAGNFGEGDGGERPAMTALENVCEHIAFHMLRDHSSTLYHHLANSNMFDKLLVFLPRWVRNMFTRELTMPQLVIVWDGVFGVYYHDEVQREDRRRRQQQGGSGNNIAAYRRSTTLSSVYAGTNPQLETEIEDDSAHRSFSRTTLGVAVALLLLIEDDLLELDDDFSLLRRLTSTPIVSPMIDASWIMNNAMAVANTRPPGVIPIHRRREALVTTENVSRAAASASATRLTKEELMLQQRSVALVVERVTKRIAECIEVDLEDTTTQHAPVRLTESNVAVIRGALRELQCVADRLSFL